MEEIEEIKHEIKLLQEKIQSHKNCIATRKGEIRAKRKRLIDLEIWRKSERKKERASIPKKEKPVFKLYEFFDLMKKQKEISSEVGQRLTGLNHRHIHTYLYQLEQKGLLKKVGTKKTQYGSSAMNLYKAVKENGRKL